MYSADVCAVTLMGRLHGGERSMIVMMISFGLLSRLHGGELQGSDLPKYLALLSRLHGGELARSC